MDVNPDFSDLLSALNHAKARFLVVGAHAVGVHTEPRYTKDLDVWVEPTLENARRVWEALRHFGAPLQGIGPEDFANPEVVYQIGIEPNRVDVLMRISGVQFATAWRNRFRTSYGGVPIGVLSRRDLVRAKLAAGRPQDLLDVQHLSRMGKNKTRKRSRRRKPNS